VQFINLVEQFAENIKEEAQNFSEFLDDERHSSGDEYFIELCLKLHRPCRSFCVEELAEKIL
jgi:hypothetical protein